MDRRVTPLTKGPPPLYKQSFKHQWRGRQRKRLTKMNTPCFKFLSSYSISFNYQMLANFSGVEFEQTVPKLKSEIRQFHVAVVQQRQRNVQKNVLPVQSCCSLRPRPNVELFMRQTKLGELSSRKVSRLAQLSSSEWVWVVQHVLSVCFRTEITALACRQTKAEI